jgi:putative ubiquitin-RnfH superfamily antitoxin RatB of RatAB toxin-antitoxin module
MRVHVAHVGADGEFVVAVDVADGATVADALRAADAAKRIGAPLDAAGLAIFGQRVDGATPLREGDRVEITRPLVCDPKAARRARAAGFQDARPRPDRRRRSAD